MKTKKCGDCIHAIICKKVNGGWFSPENFAYCQAFKDSTNFVEVVRCKECKYRHNRVCAMPYAGMWVGVELKDSDFCSYGERRCEDGR